ncbi:MAG: hypothetical protein DI587_38400 [Variovorax paradoxus]|nr:MAG: hypothetical protein DI583_38400 [Variovorax paradoxus]PZP99440.1 MAG: hypothetical protein DI587_38400 [Variovorax paradoxus]
MDLVTIEEAMRHVRTDTNADGPWFAIMIPAVSEAVRDWLKDEWRLYVLARDAAGAVVRDENGVPIPAVDGEGNPTVRHVVKAAVLIELAQQHRFRDGDGAPAVPSHAGHGYTLGQGATALLASSRRSTVA